MRFGDEDRRRGQLEFWRSADFEKLEPYDGRLAEPGVPTPVLWGETDPPAFLPTAHRLHREILGSSLVFVEGAGHSSSMTRRSGRRPRWSALTTA